MRQYWETLNSIQLKYETQYPAKDIAKLAALSTVEIINLFCYSAIILSNGQIGYLIYSLDGLEIVLFERFPLESINTQ